MSGWTTAGDLRAQVQRLWDKGRLLACLAGAETPFPLRLVLKAPSSADLSGRFEEVRAWARALQQEAKGCRLVLREVRHRVIGANVVPAEAWVDTLDDALQLAGKGTAGRRFSQQVSATTARLPVLLLWLQRHPLRALALEDRWEGLMDILAWLQAHPRPGIYLRQLDLPRIQTKTVEEHAAVLCELFDMALPEHAIDTEVASVAANLARRYGFRTKPIRLRLRVLDPRHGLLGTGEDEDITVDHASFARLAPRVSRVFITENEVNFLAFPPVPDALVLFGAGYGFDALASARWLNERAIHYWGDIDTHGFAILDQLRGHFAHVESFLMDHATLMAHRFQWTDEPRPVMRDLPRLSPAEREVFDTLRWQRLEGGRQVRLEQERVGFHHLEQALRGFAFAEAHGDR